MRATGTVVLRRFHLFWGSGSALLEVLGECGCTVFWMFWDYGNVLEDWRFREDGNVNGCELDWDFEMVMLVYVNWNS